MPSTEYYVDKTYGEDDKILIKLELEIGKPPVAWEYRNGSWVKEDDYKRLERDIFIGIDEISAEEAEKLAAELKAAWLQSQQGS